MTNIFPTASDRLTISFPTVRSSLKGAADKVIKALQEVINK